MTERTLSMMVYEDWRVKLSPEAIEYLRGVANCTNPSFQGLQAMPQELLARMQFHGLSQDLFCGVLGALTNPNVR